jgi:hypothetical protein
MFKGDLGGVAGASATCASAGQPIGRFGALIATAATDPFATLPEARYVNIHGEVVFTRKPTSLSVLEGHVLDEHGNLMTTDRRVWTGSRAGDCDGWTDQKSFVGSVGVLKTSDKTIWWTSAENAGCDNSRALYCVELP